MSADACQVIADILRKHGWTCEYHEPVSGPGECSQCDAAHARTAAEIDTALARLMWRAMLGADREEHDG